LDTTTPGGDRRGGVLGKDHCFDQLAGLGSFAWPKIIIRMAMRTSSATVVLTSFPSSRPARATPARPFYFSLTVFSLAPAAHIFAA
jgi:hypothetical protein